MGGPVTHPAGKARLGVVVAELLADPRVTGDVLLVALVIARHVTSGGARNAVDWDAAARGVFGGPFEEAQARITAVLTGPEGAVLRALWTDPDGPPRLRLVEPVEGQG